MINLLENRKFIDYCNLVLTNPYRPSSDFKEFYPYKTLEIDMNMIKRSIRTHEVENLYRSLIEFKNYGKFNGADMAILIPYNESFDLDDIEGTINSLPGGAIIFPMMKTLLPFFQ
jgi:hypothetical protein